MPIFSFSRPTGFERKCPQYLSTIYQQAYVHHAPYIWRHVRVGHAKTILNIIILSPYLQHDIAGGGNTNFIINSFKCNLVCNIITITLYYSMLVEAIQTL